MSGFDEENDGLTRAERVTWDLWLLLNLLLMLRTCCFDIFSSTDVEALLHSRNYIHSPQYCNGVMH